MWLNKIVEDLSILPTALEFFNKEYKEAKKEVRLLGNLERNSASLPGDIEYRFNQLQELEAILEYLNISLRKERAIVLRKFMENYNRELSAREAEKWVDGEATVVDLSILINEVALARNNFLGILKGLETKQWQVTNITKLRVAGIEDTEIGKYS